MISIDLTGDNPLPLPSCQIYCQYIKQLGLKKGPLLNILADNVVFRSHAAIVAEFRQHVADT